MPPRRRHTLATPLTLLVALIGAAAHPGDVQAADTSGWLTIRVALQRQASVRLGADLAHTTLIQQLD